MFESEREKLINTLRHRGIKDPVVLKAMLDVERHEFVDSGLLFHAYKDVALPIGNGQTISQPYTVAVMTERLRLKPGDKALEIGTGSGYQAAILNKMGVEVYSVERNAELYAAVAERFEKMKIKVCIKLGDGTVGWKTHSPYQGIIVTAAAPHIPNSLKQQLAVNGRLVIPVGTKSSQTLHIVTRTGDKDFKVEMLPEFVFVPLIGEEGWKEE